MPTELKNLLISKAVTCFRFPTCWHCMVEFIRTDSAKSRAMPEIVNGHALMWELFAVNLIVAVELSRREL